MNVTEMFSDLVFDDKKMAERLPPSVYQQFQQCCKEGRPLTLETANVIANAMKDWATEKGVTHFTHWFQPMTGISAEKHDSFISRSSDGGIIMEFGGKNLIKGEPDASSFPSGGLRATFEARGYTAWDPTSYAFIKDGVLCIPTAFCSYNGDALDNKTPLLRSMEALNRQAVRLLRLLGRQTQSVSVEVGPEQEYFLIDKKMCEKRKDILYTGRTLFGAKPPKGQQLDDHYFGPLKPRVVAFMKELDEELWKLGVFAKTKHNEVAPSQHELASIYTTVNIASDNNQLTMELMKKIASRHGMTCLLHEKPFEGVNGSGKHNNWSLTADGKYNLFDPGKSPEESAQFLLILSAVISAVDKHQDLLRISVTSAGNDHRLGANEAPPAIVSMFLGEELTGILQAVAEDRTYSKRAGCAVEIGVKGLPTFPMDSTDRNRTSPMAFTGNKFEFRMLGSASSIAGTNVVLNTALADEFDLICNRLEQSEDINATIKQIIKETMQIHGRIVFNGNNYSAEWIQEAQKRGLLNLPSTMDCLPLYTSEKNIRLFTKHKVLTERELRSRQEILTENYCKCISIEAMTMTEMAFKDIIPAVTRYIKDLSQTIACQRQLNIDTNHLTKLVKTLSELLDRACEKAETLSSKTEQAARYGENNEGGMFCKNEVIPAMKQLREVCDKLETVTSSQYWPFPSYGDLLFSVN